VVPVVDVLAVRSTVPQPLELRIPESGSVADHATVTSLVYQLLAPTFPVIVRVMIGGVASPLATDDKMTNWRLTVVTGAGNRLWNASASPPAYTWLLCTKTTVVGLLLSELTHTGTRVPTAPGPVSVRAMVQTAVSAFLSRPEDVEKKLETLCGVAPGDVPGEETLSIYK